MRRFSDRPFPPYRHRPGRTPHPVLDEKGHSYGQPEADPLPFDPAGWRESQDYLFGVDLFNHGYFWEAHEAWEGIWLTVRGKPQGDFLRGLIQVTAAFLKRLEGQEKGMRSLRRKAYAKLGPLAQPGELYCGIRLRDWMDRVDRALLSPSEGDDGSGSPPLRGAKGDTSPRWRIRLETEPGVELGEA
ncbi:MAG TPA: DUF309 domain-containing protein [Acidobacteriota bacterium]|nr:DUF309 domain-containing protein [Acidobacteriota bacterium]